MSSGEESKILNAIGAFREDFSLLYVKLFGDDKTKEENPQGRIPRLEAGQQSLNRRVKRIESVGLMAAGALAVFKVAGWLLDATHNFFLIFQHAQK